MKARLRIRVQPGAKRAGLRGWLPDGALKLAVAAPPEGGRANRAVVELLGETLGIRSRDVRVVQGARSRLKLIEVLGMDGGALRSRLSAALEESRADHDE